MNEYFKQLYQKEEIFLDEFPGVASVVSELLKGEWRPNYWADDSYRKNCEYFLSTNELNHLVFESAAIYHSEDRFSSAQIVLKSSKRTVTVRVKNINGKLVGEKIVDKKHNP